jgi:NAD(P) transhydrogenase
MSDFDLVVIGSGAAGEKGAVQAAYFGKRVAVVERRPEPGGARIFACALPSKALRETALHVAGLRRLPLPSIGVERPLANGLGALMCHRAAAVDAEIGRVSESFARHGVTVLQGDASFLDPHTVRVARAGGGHRDVTAGVVLIATGSTPHRPPEIPFGDPQVHDTDDILTLERIPESLLMIGGGVIGCEWASMFAALGIAVTLVDGGARLLPFADRDASEMLARSFKHLGIDVRLETRVHSVARDASGLVARLSSGEELRPGDVLFCGGRTGNTATLDLAAAGLAAGPRGLLQVSASYQTAVPHIYAAGDVIGFPALASVGMEQARVAMCHAFDLQYKSAVSPVLPLGIYTIPELSMVGETEESARAKGLDVEVGRAAYRDSPRAQLAGDVDGLVKLVFDRASKRLLGAHVVGERATDLVHVASTCLQLGGTIDTFIEAVYNYPTLSELYKYAAYDGLGRLARAR